MSKLTKDEYPRMKEFFIAWLDRFPPPAGLLPEDHPVAILERMEKELGMAKARLGLDMAINDTIESAIDLKRSEIEAIDRDFSSKGIVTLSELLVRYSRKYRAILKRGRIRNETEYYLIAGILSADLSHLDGEDIARLEMLISEYEDQASRST